MTAKKIPLPTDILALMTKNFALPEIVSGQNDTMLQAQAKLLAGMEEITREWLQRRREANETGIRAAERICSCTDPSEMMVAYFDWLGGALRRLSDDTTALSEKALALTASATSAGANGAAKPKAKPAKAKAKPKAKAKAKAESKPRRCAPSSRSIVSSADRRLPGAAEGTAAEAAIYAAAPEGGAEA